MEVSASGALVAVEIALMLGAVTAVYFTRRRLSPITEADFAALDDIERQRARLLSEIEELKQQQVVRATLASIEQTGAKQRRASRRILVRDTSWIGEERPHFVEVHHLEGIGTVTLEPDPRTGQYPTMEDVSEALEAQHKER